ncbi:HK97 gp10 family phage protein [Stutzerimonas sp. NM35]
MAWTIPPTAFIGLVENELRIKRNQIALEALQAVVSGSPVDEGTYRMNHRVSVDGVDLGYDLAAGRGKDAEPPRGASAGIPSFQEGIEIIASADQPYGEIVIQNNLPYASEIEDGHSDQASDGVYRLAFGAVVAKYGGSQ